MTHQQDFLSDPHCYQTPNNRLQKQTTPKKVISSTNFKIVFIMIALETKFTKNRLIVSNSVLDKKKN